MIIGPPANGGELLKSCLELPGPERIEVAGEGEGAAGGAARINRGLIRELGLDPYSAERLPPDWQNTAAAERAGEGIKKYLAALRQPGDAWPEAAPPPIIAGPDLGLLSPLWLAVCEEVGLEVKIIHLTRHPWEVARALLKDNNIALDSGHRLWLACHREAARACANRNHVLVTYEHLVEDPLCLLRRIGRELELDLPRNCQAGDRYPLALWHRVQATPREFYAENMAPPEKELYSVFYRLYHETTSRRGISGSAALSRALHKKMKELLRVDLYHNICARIKHFEELSSGDPERAPLEARTFWGAPIRLLPGDRFSARLYSYALVEPGLSSFLVEHLRPGRTVLDVGAHLGYFSMLSAELVGQRGRVISFEPASKRGALLKTNLASYPRVRIVCLPAGDQEGWAAHDEPAPAPRAFPGSAPRRPGKGEPDNVEWVKAPLKDLALDRYCQEKGLKPDLVNIGKDCPALPLLRGMAALLARNRPVVTIAGANLEDPGHPGAPAPGALFRFMKGFDYQVLESAAYRLQVREVREQETGAPGPIILVPAEKLPLPAPD